MDYPEIGMDLATRTGFEPVVSAVTGQRVNRYTNAPLDQLGSKTPDLSPTSEVGDSEKRSLFSSSADGRECLISSLPSSGIDQAKHIRGSLPTLSAEQIERFWSRVSIRQVGCWPWQRGSTRGGYGAFKIGKRNYPAHRIAYMLAYGAPALDHDIDHAECDNPPCCNPLHLKAVTHQANIRRAVAKPTCFRGHIREPGQICKVCVNLRRNARYVKRVPA